MFIDYDFQTRSIEEITTRIVDYIEGVSNNKSFLVIAPTGAGKTYMMSKSFDNVNQKYPDEKILIVLGLQSLVSQTYETLEAVGIEASVVHNDLKLDRNNKPFRTGFNSNVIITMPETYVNIIQNNSVIRYVPFNPRAIWFDEAHKATSELNQLIRDFYPDSMVLGTTASPYRQTSKEGEHLHLWYGNDYVITSTVKELIEIGRLTQPIYKGYSEEDNIVDEWIKLTNHTADGNRQTIVFSQNTNHSLRLCDAFNNAGIAAEIVTSGSDINPDEVVKNQTPKERNEIYARFRTQKTKVIISYSALCEGWDEPIAKYCIYARNVSNKALYQQMGGRVMRAYDGKKYCYIMDFYSNVKRFGYIEDIDWSTEESNGTTIKEPKNITRKKLNNMTRLFYTCKSCHNVFDVKKTSNCPCCHTRTEIQIEDKIGKVLSDLIGREIKTTKELKKILEAMNVARNTPGFYGYKLRGPINSMFGTKVFDETDGSLTPKFSFLGTVLDNIDTLKLGTAVVL